MVKDYNKTICWTTTLLICNAESLLHVIRKLRHHYWKIELSQYVVKLLS